MKKVLFAQAQYSRKREFTVLTKLINESGNNYIVKEAVYPEGKTHIKDIYGNYQLLQKFDNKFKIPKTNLVKDELITEYIEKANLASEIETLLIEGKIKEVNTKVKEFIDFLNTIPTVKKNPYESDDFTKLFDSKKKYFSEEQVDCWYPGFYDINLDNFIKKESKYYFVDFEWCFDFPLPKSFLILRAIFYLSLKLQNIITTKVSKDFPCISFYKNILTPVTWLEVTKHSSHELQKMLDYESAFLSSKIKYSAPLQPVVNDYMDSIIVSSYPNFGEKQVQKDNLLHSLEEHNQELKSSIQKTKEEVEGLTKQNNLLEYSYKELSEKYSNLEESTAKYQSKPYQLVEELNNTKLANFRPLRIFVNKVFSLLIKVFN